MQHRSIFAIPLLGLAALCVTASVTISFAQAPPSVPAVAVSTGSFRGQIADPSGAVIPNATIAVTTADGKTITTVKSDGAGSYTVNGLPPGSYLLLVTTQGFSPFTTKPISLAAGQFKRVDVALAISADQQQVVVTDETPTVSLSSDSNASSITIKGKDLDALSDDPDELSSELSALAGPSAGPNGGQIYIDGFTAGQLPPKSAIREIRVNQNPFSAEYDKLGYGRIEILTKPGTDKYHGQLQIQGNDSGLNTGNPYSKKIEPYYTVQFNGSVSGKITKTSSFFLSGERRNIQNDEIIAALTADPTQPVYGPIQLSSSLFNPKTRASISPRYDLQLGSRNTLSVRYQYFNNSESGDLGPLTTALPSLANTSHENEHQFQVSDSQILSDKAVNETRFQLVRGYSSQSPQTDAPQITVSGSFTGGGLSQQTATDTQYRYELQNYTQMQLTNHLLKFGLRLRDTQDSNVANSNFNGTFQFSARPCPATGCNTSPSSPCAITNVPAGTTAYSGLQAYYLTACGTLHGQTPAQITAAGGGATQFYYTTGQLAVKASQFDAGLYIQDEWKVRPNFTLSTGLRWESQNKVPDHSDWAPRLSFAYGFGHGKNPPKTVLRGGFGIFYERFSVTNITQIKRQNGDTATGQQQINITHPSCYFTHAPTASDIAQCTAGGSSASVAKAAVSTLAPSFQSPYSMQMGGTLEQQLGPRTTLALTYLYSRGNHQLVTINANAPYLPSYNPDLGNVYQFFDGGVYKQTQGIANLNTRVGQKLTFTGYYTYANSKSNSNGNPSNSGNLSQDYGRAFFDNHNSVFVIGTYAAPHGFRISPFLFAQSGRPYNITVSQDLNGDSFFNDRPAFATDLTRPTVVRTKYGNFDTDPLPGAKIIPVNYGSGPAHVAVNMRLSKTIGLGPKSSNGPGGPPDMGRGPGGGGGGRGPGGGFGGFGSQRGPGGFSGENSGRRFNLTINAQALNVFNNIGHGNPIGVVDSPLFGQTRSLAGGLFSQGAASRRVFLQAIFSF